MPVSNVQQAFRDLVQTLKKFAQLYNVPDDGASNTMKPAAAKALWRKVVLKVHPDQKGNPKDDAHSKKLNDTKERWKKLSLLRRHDAAYASGLSIVVALWGQNKEIYIQKERSL